MPAFYSQQQQSMATSLPLTPPDSGSGYNYSAMNYPTDAYASHQCPPRQDNAYDYSQGYMPQPPVAPAPSAYPYPQTAYPPNSLPPISTYYEPVGAPILPPLRMQQDRTPFGDDVRRGIHEQQIAAAAAAAAAREQQQKQAAAKEEKATGGVSAKLDYDMERMTDFVTDATQQIFGQSVQSPQGFRKWVHQVLSATRLPSATILLSLHYLKDRLVRFPATVKPGDNQVYRLLAVALILGSKFLDDNTFINRSWSDVTAIKVTELNLLEMDWLGLIDYELHIDPTAADGLPVWIDAWKTYDAKCAAKQLHHARLSPLDTTTVHRHSKDRFSPYPSPYSAHAHAAAHQQARAYETPRAPSRPSHYNTPTSYADPWSSSDRYGVEDFYKRQNRYPTLAEIDDANRRASEERARHSDYAYSQAAAYYQQPYTGWEHHAWSGVHRYDCRCSTCAYNHYRNYPMSANYAAQTVMG